MDNAIQLTTVVLPLLYALVAVCYGLIFFTDDERARRVARPIFYSTLALHFAELLMLGIRWRQFPFANVSQALAVIAFAVAVVYAVAEWRGGEMSTGFWILSVAGVFEIIAALLHTPVPPQREIFHNPLFAAHTGMGLLGYTAFVVAAGYGFLFLRLYHELKRRRFSIFFNKLPPLEVLERMIMGALTAGFAALTVAVIAGVVWAEQVVEGMWITDPKIFMTLTTWAFYGTALLLRRLRRLQGRQMAIVSLAGFAAILFSMLAVNFFFTSFHGFR